VKYTNRLDIGLGTTEASCFRSAEFFNRRLGGDSAKLISWWKI